jgi:anaerobic ribonucleoside-triphosphate reductase activating protein
MIVDDTEAEGPGHRTAVWVQGCSIRCDGCCNPEMFDARRGREVDVGELVAAIPEGVEGISVLGGEPFDQAGEVAALARGAKARGKTVMVFSGYTLGELRDRRVALDDIDLLVDGHFERTRPEPPPPRGRRWIGSTNQVMHYLTSAYGADDPAMRAPNTLEIRYSGRGLVINGWPTRVTR